MAVNYKTARLPDPPENLPKDVRDYLRALLTALRDSETHLQRALNEAEPYAKLKVIGVAPDRLEDGVEYEVDATVGAASPFGSGAGRYIVRSGVPAFIG
jgi:hypothetical protein